MVTQRMPLRARSRLVEQAAKGREFVIAKAGKPMVRVVPLEAQPAVRALGFLAGQGVTRAERMPLRARLTHASRLSRV